MTQVIFSDISFRQTKVKTRGFCYPWKQNSDKLVRCFVNILTLLRESWLNALIDKYYGELFDWLNVLIFWQPKLTKFNMYSFKTQLFVFWGPVI